MLKNGYFRAILVALLILVSSNSHARDGEGFASVTPKVLTAANLESFSIVFTVGAGGIAPGGGIKIEDPDFNGWGWSRFQHFQKTKAYESGFVTAQLSTSGGASIDLARFNLRQAEYPYTLVTAMNDSLNIGDEITVTYGDATISENGLAETPFKAYQHCEFKIYSDTDGDGSYLKIRKSPVIRIQSSVPESIFITVPSTISKGEAFEFTVRAQDTFGNPVNGYRGTVTFTSTDQDSLLPEDYTFTKSDQGIHVFSATFFHAGIQKITVKDFENIFEDVSNPARVIVGRGSKKLFWGDLHGHHGNFYERDGKIVSEYLEYAKNVSDLDFVAESPKSNTLWKIEDIWTKLFVANSEYNEPLKFIPFLSFEWQNVEQGHHNVYYKDIGPYFDWLDQASDTLLELWDLLEGLDAITIPHATSYTGSNWRVTNNSFRRQGEIFSAWGSSEESMQLGLARGNKMGIIGSTDDHYSLPGAINREGGLAAVYAVSLTREHLWNSLINRSTYGTTGERIILDFEINGSSMGSEISLSTVPQLSVYVAGTSNIMKVDIIKNNFVAYTISPNSEVASFEWIDEAFYEDCYYYVRVEQVDGEMAWSSPIWVNAL